MTTCIHICGDSRCWDDHKSMDTASSNLHTPLMFHGAAQTICMST